MGRWTVEFLSTLGSQLADPFRIGLIIALALTADRTAAVTGGILPVLLGVLFVAVIIPTTMPTNQEIPLWQLIGLGIIANLILLALVRGVQRVISKLQS